MGARTSDVKERKEKEELITNSDADAPVFVGC